MASELYKCSWRRSYESRTTTFTDVEIGPDHGLYRCKSTCDGFDTACRNYSSVEALRLKKLQKEIMEKYPAIFVRSGGTWP